MSTFFSSLSLARGLPVIDLEPYGKGARQRDERALIASSFGILPHWLGEVIERLAQERKCEEAVWISETSHGQMWTDDERARLVEMVGNVSTLELMQAFPNRSWRALHRQALLKGLLGRLPVVGPLSTERSDWHDTLCWNDWPYVEQYGLDPTGVYRCDNVSEYSSGSSR